MKEKITYTVECWNDPESIFNKIYKGRYSSTENFQEAEETYNRIFDVYDHVELIETKIITEEKVLWVK